MERGHQQTSSEVLSDFCDGSHFRCHSMFGIDSRALQFFFYYDDIEMCNPLGSHTKKHKLGKPAHAFVYKLDTSERSAMFMWEVVIPTGYDIIKYITICVHPLPSFLVC